MTTLRLTPSQQIFNHEPIQTNIPWWHTAVIYQVYPRSFQDTDGDGTGDLPGIQQRLSYLRELGVDAIWISPFYRSPMADFGYDVADYCDIDPIFGTMADFDNLLLAAHEQGIRIIIDFVPNHTSNEHPWFLESRSSRDNPKRDWYIWRDGKADGSPPNNWETFFGGSAWTYDSVTEQYYLHMFLEQQPDLNWRNPDVVAAMHDVLHFWLKKGVDGFRLDAITILIKHEDLPDLREDGDTLYGADLLFRLVDVHNQPELHPILQGFRAIVDSYPGDRVLAGETGAENFEVLMGFYGETLDEIQLPMNLRTLLLPWDATAMRESIVDYYAALRGGVLPSFVFGNHDQSRFATRFGEANHRSVNTLLLTLWGVPTMYSGDELGMVDGLVLPHQKRDPFSFQYSEFGLGRDPARTPMQWDDSPNAGFTTAEAQPWLPIKTRFASNVAEQENDPTSTLNFCRRLLQLRRQFAALNRGSIQFIDSGSELLVYERKADDVRILVVINFGASAQTIDMTALCTLAELLASSLMDNPTLSDVAHIAVRPHESLLFKLA